MNTGMDSACPVMISAISPPNGASDSEAMLTIGEMMR